jgi:hypothetical protein
MRAQLLGMAALLFNAQFIAVSARPRRPCTSPTCPTAGTTHRLRWRYRSRLYSIQHGPALAACPPGAGACTRFHWLDPARDDDPEGFCRGRFTTPHATFDSYRIQDMYDT